MSENREFCDETGFLVGSDVWKADATFRKEQREFDKLCDALRKRNERGATAPKRATKPAPKVRSVQRSCWHCGVHFSHTEKRGPAPKYCSNAHRAAAHRATAKVIAAAVAAQYRPRRPRGGQALDLTGQRFARLVVLSSAHVAGARGTRKWLVRCDCGAELVTTVSKLKCGDAKSCGCLRGRPRSVAA